MTAMPTPENHGRWWVYDHTAELLHALHGEKLDHTWEYAVDQFRDNGIAMFAECGTHAHWWWPGIFSRLELARCDGCCTAVGIPTGNGTPDNDPTTWEET